MSFFDRALRRRRTKALSPNKKQSKTPSKSKFVSLSPLSANRNRDKENENNQTIQNQTVMKNVTPACQQAATFAAQSLLFLVGQIDDLQSEFVLFMKKKNCNRFASFLNFFHVIAHN